MPVDSDARVIRIRGLFLSWHGLRLAYHAVFCIFWRCIRSHARRIHFQITSPVMPRPHLTRRWSERRTAVRSTFEMTSTRPLRATCALVRRRSSLSR
jgi:hypothetical protein